jgi:hypothetical protein
LLELKTEVYSLKRKGEMIQASLNNDKEIILELIETLLEKEMQVQLQKLNSEAKKLSLAKEYVDAPSPDTQTVIEVRNLYHKLAKKLHPDLIGTPTESQKVLWLNITEAYRSYNLTMLEYLELLSENETATEVQLKSSREELEEKVKVISSYLTKLLAEIEQIKTDFPFTIEKELDEPLWVEQENNKSLGLISKLVEERQWYRNKIQTLINEQ